MANEFFYNVRLSIVHPTVDPMEITKVIKNLHPRIQTMAGALKLGKNGLPIVPNRRAALSHWSANLHDEQKLYSGDKPISEFILTRLSDLEEHRSLFFQLREEGQIILFTGLFSITNCSAGVLSAPMMKKCGDLGIEFEFHFYSLEISDQRLR